MPRRSPHPPAVEALVTALGQVQPMRRGSLSERRVKCSKPGCPCATDPDARHGPYFSLTRGVKGTTVSRFVSPEEAPVVRRQVQAARAFRKQVEALWRACEAWADDELEALHTDQAEGAEKAGSRRRSPRRLRPRSPG